MADVTILAPNAPSAQGGVERFCWYLGAGLRAAGMDVEHLDSSVAAPTGESLLDRYGFREPMLAASMARGARLDAAETLVTNGVFGWPYVDQPGINVFHGTYRGMAENVFRRTAPRTYLECRLVIASFERRAGKRPMSVAVSESARRELTRWYGMRDVEVIENAVDVDHFIPGPRSGMLGRSEDDRLLVLFVGSPHRVKGVDRLSAFATANADWCDVVAAGLPPEGMVEGVRCIGAVPYGQLPALYREADFLVMPSRYEACSFVLLEALSCGLPALTTSVGTAPDIARRCPTLAPLVIEEWSAVEVARACRVLQDSSRRAELGVASREYAVAHHGLAPFVAKYAAALAEAAQR